MGRKGPRSQSGVAVGMEEMGALLERWGMDEAEVRRRLYRAPTPWEREGWHALWLLAQDWAAAAVAHALERDAHTIGQWYGRSRSTVRRRWLLSSREVPDWRQFPHWSHDKPDDNYHPREASRRSSRSLPRPAAPGHTGTPPRRGSDVANFHRMPDHLRRPRSSLVQFLPCSFLIRRIRRPFGAVLLRPKGTFCRRP